MEMMQRGMIASPFRKWLDRPFDRAHGPECIEGLTILSLSKEEDGQAFERLYFYLIPMTAGSPTDHDDRFSGVCFFVAPSFTGGALTVGSKCRRYE